MSQTRYKLPDDLKATCINLVRGYDRRVKKYHDRRSEILYGRPSPGGSPLKGNRKSDPVASKAILLGELDNSFDTLAIQAVEQARLLIGVDCVSEEVRRKLMIAIWDSCIEGRNFNYEYYALPMGTNNFYERRRRFLWNIASNMGFL